MIIVGRPAEGVDLPQIWRWNKVKENNVEQRDLEQLKQRLEFQRHEALQVLRRLDYESKSLDVDSTHHSADCCLTSISKEPLFERSSQRRTVLRLVEAALKRIADGSFGVCIGCGDDIQAQRLEALPWTQFCIRCQGELEQEVGSSLSAGTLVPKGENWRRAG